MKVLQKHIQARLIGGAVICLVTLGILRGADVPILIDLSQAHDLKTVLESSLRTTEWTAQSDRNRHFTISEGQNLRFRLPGGMEVQQTINQGSMNVDKDGKLCTMNFYGGILPTNEAYEVAVKIHQAFGIPTQRLEKWLKDNEGKGRDAKSYSNATENGLFYPHVFMEVQSSMNELYPWTINMEFGWNCADDDEKDLGEKWGAEHNPRPPPGLEKLSLDSPSGKTYSRKDAYREINAKQEEFERKLGQVSVPDGKLLNPPQATQPAAVPQAESKSWFVWLLVVIAAIGLLWLILKHRK